MMSCRNRVVIGVFHGVAPLDTLIELRGLKIDFRLEKGFQLFDFINDVSEDGAVLFLLEHEIHIVGVCRYNGGELIILNEVSKLVEESVINDLNLFTLYNDY